MLGRESAIEGAIAEDSGGRMALVDREGSNIVDIMTVTWLCLRYAVLVLIYCSVFLYW